MGVVAVAAAVAVAGAAVAVAAAGAGVGRGGGGAGHSLGSSIEFVELAEYLNSFHTIPGHVGQCAAGAGV